MILRQFTIHDVYPTRAITNSAIGKKFVHAANNKTVHQTATLTQAYHYSAAATAIAGDDVMLTLI